MKKPLLLVIANESYFQSSFLDVFSKEIKTSDYFINDIIVLKQNYKKSLQYYLIKNLSKIHIDEILKLFILKFIPSLYFRFIIKNKINYVPIKNIFKKYNYNTIYVSNINDQEIVKFIKNKKYSFIINTANQIYNFGMYKNYKNKIINIHLSLLPKYSGIWTMFQQLSCNEKNTGITVHKINKNIDSGKLVINQKISLNKKLSLFENQIRCYQKIPKLLKKSLKINFKSKKKIKNKKIFGYPNDLDWINFRKLKNKII